MKAEIDLDVLRVHERSAAEIPVDYLKNGVVAVRDVLSQDDVSELRRNVERYRKWLLPAVPADWLRREADGSIRGMYFMDRVDPWFKSFGSRDDLRNLVETITCSSAEFRGIETFDKPARVGSASLPHQDGIYFAGTSVRLAHIWLPLDEVQRSNGPLHYWPGSQGQLMRHVSTVDPHLLQIPDELVASLPLPHMVLLRPGDATVHSDRVVHGSPANTSQNARRAVAIAWALTVN